MTRLNRWVFVLLSFDIHANPRSFKPFLFHISFVFIHHEQVGSEIMRAVHKLNDAFYTNGALTDLLDAFNFLSLTGMFDNDQSNALSTLSPYVKDGKDYDGTREEVDDEVKSAVKRVNDLAIEYLLKYPDMEWWVDRSFDMAALQEKGIDFISIAIAKQTMKSSPSTSKEAQAPVQEIQTPRVANVECVI